MVELAKKALLFIVVFLIVFLIDYFITIKKAKKFNRKKLPVNLNYLILKYNIDVVRIGYKKIVKELSLCDSFMISILFVLTDFIKNIYIRMLVCFILIIPFFTFIYYLLAKYYRKECD